LLWPDSTDAQAHTNLRQLLHRLRHGLPQADRFVRIEKQTLQWQPVAPWTLDVADFERGIAQADEAEQAHDQTAARQALEQAVEVYREDLLPSCYDEWILPERERLRQRFLGALDRLLLLHEQEGNYQAAISAAQRLLRHDPLQEATYRHLMRLYAASGDRAAALRTYHTCVTVLERGLAAEPSAATRAEYERLLQKEEPSPLPVAPPLLEAETAQASKSNLPVALTPLIGREHEVQAACTLLRRPEVHLLTLSGTGGVGKTRLALQVASELLNDFADGVCFVPLAPISDPHLVIATIAQTLGLKETGERALLDLLKVYLQEQHFLLVLDNFEQILEAAPRLADLLTGCPKLKMLVTSRAVLHIQGENEFALPPLAVPDLKRLPALESLSHYAAVALFLDRAKAIHPDFHLTQANAPIIAEICARLDGLPLAIELAAPRLKLLSPQGLLARLSHRLQLLTGGAANLPLRQQTMRNTIQWSYEQLSPQEQQLFRRLSVFVGDCTLEAVEALCTAFGDVSANVLDRLASLLDESLLQRVEQEGEEPRLRLLETIREFGLECLLASGELEAVQHAHATYYLWLLEEAWQNISLAEQWRWHARMEQEYDNLRAALRWSVEQGGTTGAETVLRLSLELVQFWLVSGRVSEGRSFMEQALAHSEEGVTFARARGLLSAGRLAFTQDDYDQAEALLKQSQVVYRELADLVGVGATLQKLGTVALARSNYPLARRLSQEALAHFREASKSGVDDKLLMLVRVLALDNLVHIGIVQGEHSRARSLAEECLVLSRQSGDRRNTATSLFHLALLAFSRGEQAVARSLVEECLTISRGIRYQGSLAFSLGLLGLMALQQDDETGAHALLAESLMIRRQVEDLWSSRWGLYCLGWVAFERWEPPMARALYEKLLSVLGQLDDTEFLTTCLEGLGSVIAAGESVENPEGKSRAGKQSREAATRWAVRLWGMAEALRKASRLPLLPHHSPLYERTITAVRTQLDEKEFAAAWAEGQTMRPQEALAALRRAEMPRPLPAPTPAGPSPVGLSAREVEVLRLVAQGLTSAQVAEQLVISPRTVNWYLTVIYSKLGVSSRSAATRYAIEHHLL
jgi:predicted ATPase/DNA-binding SARP family transcriptional activator/DNA-binding CsgD family transcriptional regulator